MEKKINLPTAEMTYSESLEFMQYVITEMITRCNNLALLICIYDLIDEEIESAPLN